MILGIDLGTTRTVVATVAPSGEPDVLPNALGEFTTPSVVYFESDVDVLVGSAALAASAVDSDNAVALVKRQMGTECAMYFHGVRHTPESISALILRAVVDAVSAEPVRAVITVPAYFGIREREATYQAAVLAGIEVLELLSEPAAAALSYATSPGAVLVYDLGGGTFDTTVLRVGSAIEVVATDGDSALGGADWDARIASFLLESFARAVPDVDPYEDDAFVHEVNLLAEKVKRDLSRVDSRTVALRCGGCSASVVLERAACESMCADLVDRTLTITHRVLAAAREKRVLRVGEVVLVGGSSRMPVIARAVSAALGLPTRLADPDFAVARGAALRAFQLAGEDAASLRTVVPRAFGVLVDDSHDPSGTGRLVVHMVHQNDPLPTSSMLRFSTIVDGQDRVRVQIFEQAGDVASPEEAHNRRVLDGELSGLPALPAGSLVEVTLTVSADGLLSVTAREPRSGATLTLEAYVDGVVDSDASAALSKVLNSVSVTL